jgi:phage terminase large subunit
VTAPSWALAAADAFDPPPLVNYTPHGAASVLFATTTPEVCLSGPAGTGKSMACLMRLHLAALANPGIRCLVVRKTAVSLGSTTLVTYEKRVATEALEAGLVSWYGGSPKEAAAYRYRNGSRIVVGGMDKPEKVLSSEYDIVFVDEATELTITDWETLGTRLRNGVLPWQQQIAACNPSFPSHWLKQRSQAGPLTMLESRHEDNPWIYQNGELTEQGAAYMVKLDNLTGVRKQRLRFGQWSAAEGTIYEEWDDAVHLIDRFPIPKQWTRWWTVDFGFTNPFVLQCWAEDNDGRLFKYRELYRTKRLVEDHAADILKIVAPDGEWIEPKPRAVICDHDAEDRATLERHLGMSTSAAKKTVSDGIQAVKARLAPAGDGRPRLFILRDSLVSRDTELDEARKPCSTVEEIPGYVWDQRDGKPPKETPVKEDDHGMDTMRYMVAERDLGGRPRMRWLG